MCRDFTPAEMSSKTYAEIKEHLATPEAVKRLDATQEFPIPANDRLPLTKSISLSSIKNPILGRPKGLKRDDSPRVIVESLPSIPKTVTVPNLVVSKAIIKIANANKDAVANSVNNNNS